MDTRNKRASALGIGLAALVVLPAPDGAITQPDRQHVAYCYAGIAAGALISYEFVELTDVTLTFATLSGVALAAASLDDVALTAATLTNVTVEPD